MKRLITLLIASVLCTNAFANEWIFGVEAGGNIAYLDGQGKMDYVRDQFTLSSNQVLGGGFIGGTAQYHIDDFWGLRGEIYYSQQGSKYSAYDASTGEYGTVFRRSNFINVPIMGYISFGRFTIMAGPSFDFCVGGKDYFKDWLTRTPEPVRWASTGFNVFDFALCVGLEFMIWDCAGLFIRYNHGFCNQFTESLGTPAYGKNRVGQIGIIYKFGQ